MSIMAETYICPSLRTAIGADKHAFVEQGISTSYLVLTYPDVPLSLTT